MFTVKTTTQSGVLTVEATRTSDLKTVYAAAQDADWRYDSYADIDLILQSVDNPAAAMLSADKWAEQVIAEFNDAGITLSNVRMICAASELAETRLVPNN